MSGRYNEIGEDVIRLRFEATQKRMDWAAGGHYANWRQYVGSSVKAVWHTLTDDQKVAIATDAKERARNEEEKAEYLMDS